MTAIFAIVIYSIVEYIPQLARTASIYFILLK